MKKTMRYNSPCDSFNLTNEINRIQRIMKIKAGLSWTNHSAQNVQIQMENPQILFNPIRVKVKMSHQPIASTIKLN